MIYLLTLLSIKINKYFLTQNRILCAEQNIFKNFTITYYEDNKYTKSHNKTKNGAPEEYLLTYHKFSTNNRYIRVQYNGKNIYEFYSDEIVIKPLKDDKINEPKTKLKEHIISYYIKQHAKNIPIEGLFQMYQDVDKYNFTSTIIKDIKETCSANIINAIINAIIKSKENINLTIIKDNIETVKKNINTFITSYISLKPSYSNINIQNIIKEYILHIIKNTEDLKSDIKKIFNAFRIETDVSDIIEYINDIYSNTDFIKIFDLVSDDDKNDAITQCIYDVIVKYDVKSGDDVIPLLLSHNILKPIIEKIGKLSKEISLSDSSDLNNIQTQLNTIQSTLQSTGFTKEHYQNFINISINSVQKAQKAINTEIEKRNQLVKDQQEQNISPPINKKDPQNSLNITPEQNINNTNNNIPTSLPNKNKQQGEPQQSVTVPPEQGKSQQFEQTPSQQGDLSESEVNNHNQQGINIFRQSDNKHNSFVSDRLSTQKQETILQDPSHLMSQNQLGSLINQETKVKTSILCFVWNLLQHSILFISFCTLCIISLNNKLKEIVQRKKQKLTMQKLNEIQ